jgi:hypothetical protein
MFVFTVGAIDELVETAEDFGTASVWAVAAGCTATIQHWPLTRPQPSTMHKINCRGENLSRSTDSMTLSQLPA